MDERERRFRRAECMQADAIILNWNRPGHLLRHTIPTLLDCDGIRHIIVSHGKEDTYFESPDPRVECHRHFDLNAVHGLSLRFYCRIHVKTDAVLILDDDQIIQADHVHQLLESYESQPERIHGFYPRYAFHSLQGINYGWKEIMHKYVLDPLFIWQFVRGRLKPCMVLTAMMIAPKPALDAFWSEKHRVEYFVKEHSVPLWNGEDIFLNLLYLARTGLLPVAIEPCVALLKTPESHRGISGNKPFHGTYRRAFFRHVCETLSLRL